MDSDEFYEMAQDPTFPNEMMFELTAESPEPDRTFSSSGLNGIADQMYAFMLARTFSFWKFTGNPARKIRARLSLELLDADGNFIDRIENGALPYFEAGDINGLSQADGSKRIPRERLIPLDE
jgi:hypothetical protein